MKAIKILIYLLIISMNTSVNAQECYTPSSAPPAWLFTPVLRSTATQSAYTLRVYFHIVRNNGGNGLSANILSTMLSRLNTEFTATGIQFQSIGYEFIDNSTYYDNLSISEIPLLCAVNSHSNAIDIYVLGTSTTGMTSGVAANIPATAYIVHGSRYNTTTVTHEMGHCLGLYHTHHGTVTEVAIDGTNPDPAQCRELVNGSNAATCGDYITDTPADPNYWNNCNYIGGNSIKDDNYQIYSPNPANYMSYSSYTCRNMFTPAQGQRMRDFIANTPILQNVVVLNLSVPAEISPSGVARVANLPSSATITWSSARGKLAFSSAIADSVTVTAKEYNATDTVIATLKQNGTTFLTLRQPIRSCEFSIQAKDYSVSCTAHLFSVPLISGGSVVWSCHPSIYVVQQEDNYIKISVGDTLANGLWLSATAKNAVGTTVATRSVNLPNHNLKRQGGLYCFTQWYELINGVRRKRYGFVVNIPTNFSLDDLCFNWRSTDSNTGTGLGAQIPLNGSAMIETGGTVGVSIACVDPTIHYEYESSDNAVMLTNGTTYPQIDDFGTPNPYVPTNVKNFARVTLPAGDYLGTITCTVSSPCGVSFSSTYSVYSNQSVSYIASTGSSGDVLTLQKISDSPENRNETVEVYLYYSGVQVMYRQARSTDAEITLNTSGLRPGAYQLVVLKNKEMVQSQTVIVN